MSAAVKHVPKGNGLLPASLAKFLSTASYVLAVIGIAIGIAGFASDRVRFGYSFLVGFVFTMTICVGAMFLVTIQHLTKAGWSVAPRRILEWISQGAMILPLLFIPLGLLAPAIWHQWMGAEAKHDELLEKKASYLNQPFFYGRAVVFLLIWALVAFWFYKGSREQDRTGDRKLSERMQAFSAPAIFLLGLSVTFAGFDWVMSLLPHWYSTIFGVYIFAGGFVTALAVLSLVVVRWRKSNIGGDLLTVEHQHDVGKFLFGFTIFWAYIGFSQFILIWYANIPEETIFFRMRWTGGWENVSLALLFGHFVIPFLILISRTGKRTPGLLTLAAGILVVMHFVDIYWLVMPNLTVAFTPSWIDIGGWLAPVGITLAFISTRVLGHPAYPLRDPYIPEALKAENL